MSAQAGPSASGAGPSQTPRDVPGQSNVKKDQRFIRRAVSPGNLSDTRRISATSGALAAASTLTAPRPAGAIRARDKFVPLPDASSRKSQVVVEETEEQLIEPPPDSAASQTLSQKRGRITVITVAESFNRKALEGVLHQIVAATTTAQTSAVAAAAAARAAAAAAAAAAANGAGGGAGGSAPTTGTGMAPLSRAGSGGAAAPVPMAMTAYPEVSYVRTPHGEAAEAPGEVFFFDYGVVAFWGMTEAQEQALLDAVVCSKGVAVGLLDEDERQVEELLFVYSRDSPPNIRNDTFTIDSRLAADHQVKMAISHALAQSSKLAVYEERMVGLIEEVRHVPREMAERGAISLSRRKVAQLMGKVFLLKAAVNLTATMLDIPEFFWRAPDQLQSLYERACEYLDIKARMEMLNTRFLVLQRMLDIWSDHSAHQNLARLDIIIVLLILIEVVMAGMEVVGFLMRRRGWEWHGPKLGQILWGAGSGLGRALGLGDWGL
ncbi:sporulation protein rmd1 [Pleodorina starrii]|uniref:Sporulation protein rmd1 n=1 Tax=Pleodorina starrii TaxID=330485 RepID=A0A9W6BCI9_9CHLO|nr:sporulation protein rmd1 [Pleodorina starrii]GLC49659.1 sporulation protein rmd1 [Pleodorina starrii]GLC65603.1 sporulation protein rmd1 [Pleodorina starrii]